MRKYILSSLIGAVCTLAILFTIAIIKTNQDSKDAEYPYSDLQSDTSAEDCFICGEDNKSILSFYWGEDNVGIINLNTLEILPLEINRYNDTKQLITEKAGYMQQSSIGDNKAYAYAAVFPDEGYADVRISGTDNSIERKHIEDNFCQTCLDSMNDRNVGSKAPSGFAIISFSERTIHPLLETYTRFTSGNYGIDCNYEDDGEIDLLIHLLRTGF